MSGGRVHKGRYARVQDLADLKRILIGQGYDLFAWQDQPGAVYLPHSHPHDEYIVVQAGTVTFKIKGRIYTLGAGDALELPANTIHEAINDSDSPVSYFICTKPKG